jgi:hypothetical protein
MAPKPKNIIMFVSIGVVFALIYIFFFRGDSDTPDNLVSSNPIPAVVDPNAVPVSDVTVANPLAQDFLSLLLNIKAIKLNDAIFSDVAFQSLHDSSIVLIPDGNEGRPNPFAPIGVDIGVTPNPPSTPTPPPANTPTPTGTP